MATFQAGNDTADRRSYYRIFKDGSVLNNSAMNHEFAGCRSNENPSALSVYDSPVTSSAITYDVRFQSNGTGDTAKIHYINLSIFEFAN